MTKEKLSMLLFVWATTLIACVSAEVFRPKFDHGIKPITQVYAQYPSGTMPAVEVHSLEYDPLMDAKCLGKFRLTYYCCENYPHICGSGTGMTASGRKLEVWKSIAVDPRVIPLGSQVAIDFGDGELLYFSADDTGGAVGGKHIDIAVATHAEALAQTRTSGTVYIIPQRNPLK